MDNGASSYRRFLEGDDSGLVDIIKEYKDGLILYLNNFTDNILAAEEIMEETFVKLATKKPSFSGKSSFKTWLYAIGRNTAVDYIRHSSRRKTHSIEDYPSLAEEEDMLEKSILREERKLILHSAMKKLKPEHRQILYLIFFEEFRVDEAAGIMRKSKHQTENLLYRAKLSLKSKLEKEGFVYEEL